MPLGDWVPVGNLKEGKLLPAAAVHCQGAHERHVHVPLARTGRMNAWAAPCSAGRQHLAPVLKADAELAASWRRGKALKGTLPSTVIMR